MYFFDSEKIMRYESYMLTNMLNYLLIRNNSFVDEEVIYEFITMYLLFMTQLFTNTVI